jgi:putative PIN family toxin of toxin-antitoxin system
MRIVLDTNVLARATPGKAGPAAAVRLAIRPPHLLVLSPYLLTELGQVLRYDRLRRMHGLADERIDLYLASLQLDALVVDVAATQGTIVPNDPKDDPIVMTAVGGQADVLCTLDKHLHQPEVVKFCAGHRVRVLSDLELLTELRAG